MPADEHLNGKQFATHMPVSELLPHVDHTGGDEGYISHLADSMRREGYRPEKADNPITLVWHQGEQDIMGNDVPVLAEGQHRVKAAHEAGITHLPVDVHDLRGS